MKYIKSKLSRQLLSIIVVIFSLAVISFGFLLPKALLPVYENTLYNYLRQPLTLVEEDMNHNLLDTEVAYLYLYNGEAIISDNLQSIVGSLNVGDLLTRMPEKYGKFLYMGEYYYYYTIEAGNVVKIALTNDSYLLKMHKEVLSTTLPIIVLTFALVSLILITWSGKIVHKVEKLKAKIDHIDDDEFDHSIDSIQMDDELRSLAMAIEDMRISLKNQEELRNQTYQNISHDFKTPLTVIKSYIEAVHDGVEDEKNALLVIEEQTDKLEQKVHSLLYLNKLDYIKNCKNIVLEEVNVKEIITSSVEKFKFRRKDIVYKISMDENSKFYGTIDLWETVIDNLLNNFMRYAKNEIKITVKKDKMVFYNDGENIDQDLLNVLFVPFRKGMKGEFGLGLSIIQKAVGLMGYEIDVKNHKKGVSFTIMKGTRR